MNVEKIPMPTQLKTEPNMLKIGTVYSITINPDDQHQKYGTEERYKMVHRYYRRMLSKYNWECLLYPEISSPMESTRKPRIHYHGLISFKNTRQLLSWYEHIAYDLGKFTYYKLDTWDGKETYVKYSSKNNNLMKAFCKHYKMEYRIESLQIRSLMQSYINSLETH